MALIFQFAKKEEKIVKTFLNFYQNVQKVTILGQFYKSKKSKKSVGKNLSENRFNRFFRLDCQP